MKLNQVVSIEKTIKNQAKQALTELHHAVQKAELVSGFNKTYQPLDDEKGEKFPAESKKVTVRVSEAIETAREQLTRLFDVTATKDVSNNDATADIIADGKTIATQVPITTLLFLEKQLVDLRTFVAKLPVLDAADEWVWSDQQNLYSTAAVKTVKTKKVEKVVVKYEATKEHPAQTEIRPEDQTIGYWSTIKYSGALPATEVKTFMRRVETLQEAVKVAREDANSVVAKDAKLGTAVLSYIFGPAKS
jgi:hypothetical protein